MEFKDFFYFDKFLTPLLIKIVYYLGLVFWVIAGVGMMISVDVLKGIGLLVLGPLWWRMVIELSIVIFEVFDEVKEVKQLLKQEKEQ